MDSSKILSSLSLSHRTRDESSSKSEKHEKENSFPAGRKTVNGMEVGFRAHSGILLLFSLSSSSLFSILHNVNNGTFLTL